MKEDNLARGADLLRWLVGPSERITGEEERRGARLLASLALVHILLSVLVGALAVALRWRLLRAMLLWGPVGVVLLVGVALVLVAYLFVRTGRYRAGLGLYIATTASFPLLATFVGRPQHEVGLLATALIPVVIAATLLSHRWLIVVCVAVVACAAAELTMVSWPAHEVASGFAILCAVLASGGLALVMRRHQAGIESMRAGELQRTAVALRASQDRLNALLGASRDLVVVLNAKGERQAAFGAVEEVTGYDPSGREPNSHFEAMHPEDRQRIQNEFAELLKHPGKVVRTEWRYRHKDGTYRWHEGLVTNRLGQEGVDGVVVNVRDVTDRKAAERASARNEQRYRMLFETVTDGIFLLGHDGHLIEVNDGACRMLGYTREELLSLRLEDIAPEEKREHVQEINRTVAEQGHSIFEAWHRRKDGTTYPVEVAARLTELDGVPVFMGVARDISARVRAEVEKQRLQEQLQHAGKMESMGRLAGGVAHDFNNLLTAIIGNTDLALFQLGEGGNVREALTEIRAAALSAANVTRQLLAFSRKHVIEARLVDVNALIRQMQGMLERVIGEDVRLRTLPGTGLGTVRVDPGLIEQAIVNLVVNARDAMPSGGDLSIETSDVTLDEAHARIHPMRARGRHVLIAIRDTGSGMSDEVKSHLFEPFFTTKPAGKGTGLGLATTYAAIEQNGGNIEVYSELGKGTTFKIYLPVVAGAAEQVAVSAAAEPAELPGGHETILVVEDEARVREVVVQSLGAWGYEVLVTANGEEALAMGVARKSQIHLLLTDVVMPGMNGRDLSRMLAKIHPETRTLFTSGYGENIIAHRGALDEGIDFLGKPYTMDVLARKVREILDRE